METDINNEENNFGLLEKALKRFERTKAGNIGLVRQPYLDPDWYSLRVDGFRLVLTKSNPHYEDANKTKEEERYELNINYAESGVQFMTFKEDYQHFGKIKYTYGVVKEKVEDYEKREEAKKKIKEEKNRKKSLKKLKRLL